VTATGTRAPAPLTAASDDRDPLRESEALANLSRAAFEHPYDPDIQYALGVALRDAGARDAAVLALTRATQLPIKTHSGALLHRTLAETLEAKGDLARAVATMRLSLSAKRGARRCSSADERYLAQLLVKAGELDAAVAFLRPLYTAAASPDEAARCKAFLSSLVPDSPSVADRLSRPDEEVLSNPYRAPAREEPTLHPL
jgi:Flp pilus assembly protein TadD